MNNNFDLLSKQQQAIWIVQQLQPESSIYNLGGHLELKGEIDVDRFTAAVKKAMESFDVLEIVSNFLKLEKVTGPHFAPFTCVLINNELENNGKEWFSIPLQLEKKLVEFLIFPKHNQLTYVYFKAHHIVFDGFSINVILNKVIAFYENSDSALTNFSYQNFIIDEKKYATSDEFLTDQNFWKEKLSRTNLPGRGFSSLLATPKLNQGLTSGRQEFVIPRKLFDEINLFCKENQSTTFHYFIAVILILNKKYNSPDFILGLLLLNRRNKNFRQTAGMFVDTIPFYNEIDDTETFEILIKKIKQNTRQDYRHQKLPIIDLNQLFDESIIPNIFFSYQKIGFASKIDDADIKMTSFNSGEQVEDLMFHLYEFSSEDDVVFAIEYKESSISYSEIERLSNHLMKLITNCKDSSNQPISELNYLTQKEQQQLIVEFNDTKTNYSSEKTIPQLFEEQVERTPDQIALVFGDKELTYTEVNEIANQLGDYLRKKHSIQPDDTIAILLERSEWLVLSIWGALKSGGAYVPIDPRYPQDRIDYMLKDSSAKVLIDQNELNQFFSVQKDYSKNNLKLIANSRHLAYTYYTSGSTGKPKGVLAEHRNVVAFFDNIQTKLGIKPGYTFLGITNYTFDPSVLEYIGSLVHGLKIELVPDYLPGTIYNALANNQINCLQITPSRLLQLIDYDSNVIALLSMIDLLLLGGEAFPEKLVSILDSNNTRILNVYGPTETTLWSSAYHVVKGERTTVGTPLNNDRFYILDPAGNLLPIGAIGEICISGDGVARGYLNRPELTAKKFVLNPFEPGTRLYKSGDLGRWLPDGKIEFHGRNDDQVKIRGHRIELGEIEGVLSQYETIKKCAVIARENEVGDARLIAYWLAPSALNSKDVRKHLKESLPDYMVPDFLMQLDDFPLTPNGKMDKKRLPNPDSGINGSSCSSSTSIYVAPTSNIEIQLVRIWSELLAIEKENIGIQDDFFAIGGNSLTATTVISRVSRELSVRLTINDLFTNQTIENLAFKIENTKESTYREIPVLPVQESYELSSAQKSLWILSQFEQSNNAYNIPVMLELVGDLDIELFKASFNRLIARHESLRTVFKEDEQGDVRQWILPADNHNFKFNYQDVSNYNNQEQTIKTIVSGAFQHAFDLKNDSLLRALLLQRSSKNYIFTFVVHHIITDGWSTNILIRDLLEFYNGLKNKREIQLPALRIQYKDYAAWQQNRLKDDATDLIASKTFWQDQFSGDLPVLNLPIDKVRPVVQTFNGGSIERTFSKELTQQLSNLTTENGATLFMALLTSVKVLLHKYTGQTDIIIGSALAGRVHVDLTDQIGYYINTLALRTEFTSEISFQHLLKTVAAHTLKAYEHQSYPLYELVNDLNLKRDLSSNPLFDVMIILQNNELVDFTGGFEGLEAKLIKDQEENSISKFELSFLFKEVGDEISVQVDYNSDLFHTATIERLGNHLIQLTQSIVDNPNQPISELTPVSKKEQHQILVDFNDTTADYPTDKTIIELFEKQVTQTPDKVAIVFEDAALSYTELNEITNQLGDYLRKKLDIQPDDLVAVMLDRSEWMVISILGVLKSGGAYVPIDPEHPQERIDYILEDSNAKMIINQVELDSFLDNQSNYNKTNPELITKSNNLAYVIYTSGSTGKPKGCMLEHSGVVNRIDWQWHKYNFSQQDIFLQKTTVTFDVSVWELFKPICYGATMIIASREDVYDQERTYALIEKHRVTCVHFVPSILNQFILVNSDKDTENLSLKCVITSGEALGESTVNDWISKFNTPIYNLYGPTEASIDVTHFDILDQQFEKVLIGRPISNTQIYIIDKNENLLPLGIEGEICISGVGLARGYLNRPELTNEKFVSNPFRQGERMYKTGDVGRWLPDGNIEYIGRNDDQVKIRGHRIELGEIEACLLRYGRQGVLNQYEDIRECVVIARESETGDKHLVAYLQAPTALDTKQIRTDLKGRVPDYMVPSYFVQLDEFPLSSNGKLDRKSLPNPDGLGFNNGMDYKAPENAIEKQLAQIWSSVFELELGKISIDDDFFELGGHSLKATRMISEISKELSIKLSIKDIFTNTTLEELAEVIENAQQYTYKDIPVLPFQESYELSSAQRRLWVLNKFEHGNYAYNIPAVFEFEGVLDIKLFQASFNKLIARHESLRTVFKEDAKGDIKQWILPEDANKFKFNYQNIGSQNNQERTIASLINKELQHVFDLENDALLRATLIQKSSSSYTFVFVMHHIISDGWSMNILVRDLLAFYNGLKNKTNLVLPTLRIQYKDFAAWKQATIQNEDLNASKTFWQNQFSGDLPVLNMPLDKPRPAIKTFNGSQINLIINQERSQNFKAVIQENGATLFIGLLASVNVLLHKYTGQTDIILGSPLAGRDHIDLNDQLGFYINTLALRTTFNATDSFNDLLESINANTLAAFEHQAYPFDQLIDELNLPRDTSRNPLFDVMVALQNNERVDVNQGIEGLEIKPFENLEASTISKFDLTFNFTEINDEIVIEIEYNSDLFSTKTIKRLGNHLNQLIDALVINPSLPIAALNYLSQKEQHQLLVAFNDTKADYPLDKTIIQVFETQVERTPNQIALVFEGETLTYSELNEKANQLGHHLKQTYSIQPDDFIGILLDRSEWMLIAILGVLKSGGAYVPINLDYPQERIDFILKDSNARALIDQAELDKFSMVQDNYNKANVNTTTKPNHLAYVIYTSGSTGKPKGVLVEHRNVINLIASQTESFEFSSKEKVLQFSNVAFDASVEQIFLALFNGAQLHILNAFNINDVDFIGEYIEDLGITHFHAVPGFIEELNPKSTQKLNRLIAGGDQWSKSLLRNAHNYSDHFINEYGPTEVTVTCIQKKIQHGVEMQNIGKPIANTRVYILDNDENLLPLGAIGEICITGDGVSRGYLNRPELTAKKFTDNPFEEGKRMYKTGDLGRWLPDGNIEFLTRKDDQVKIRGFRIELGEIERVLHQYEAIQDCLVVPKHSKSGMKELVAYLTSKEVLNTQALRTYLKKSLPEYMVPRYFVQLSAFPLNSNGKLDKKALPNPDSQWYDASTYVAPSTETEKQLVKIWSEFLEIQEDKIGIHDEFFALGGNSMKSIKTIKKIKQLGYQIDIVDLFSNPTIHTISQGFSVNADEATNGQAEATVSSEMLLDNINLFNHGA